MKKMKGSLKKVIGVSIIVAILASIAAFNVGAKDIEVYLDGEKMEFDTEIYIENDRVMIPMRSLFEKKGMRVYWQEATRSITATKENKKISMQVGNHDIINDGVSTTYDVAAQITDDGRTMIPLRAVGESLGLEVEWNSSKRHVYLTSEKGEEKTVDDSWKENIGEINLDAMTATGSGVSIEGNVIKITEGGDFTVSGTLSDGYIHVNTESRVKLRLSGVSIINSAGSAIYFENADKCFITLSKDSENVLTDGSVYSDTELKGTLYAKDDLEIKGEGKLTVNANYKHAIAGNDEIKIEEGVIVINSAVSDGIRVNDGIEMTGGSLDITAFGDAIQSEGYITLTGGEIKAKTIGTVVEDEAAEVVDGVVVATTSAKGIKSESVMTISGAVLNLDTTDNAIDSADMIVIDSGDINIISKDKGISGEGDVTVNDGNIVIDCVTEGIESKNVLAINGGSVDITAVEDGLNTGGGTTFFGGMGGGGMRPGGNRGEIPQMPEGMTPPEGTQRPPRPVGGNMGEMMPPEGMENGEIPQILEGMTPPEGMERPQRPVGENMGEMMPPEGMENGEMPQMPEGMTPPEGMERPPRPVGENMGEMMPPDGAAQDNTAQSEEENKNVYECHDLYINGGTVKINANGDGVDSNGKIFVTGGTLIVDGPVNSGNGAIDTDTQFVVTGGEIIAVGSSGMAVAPTASVSTQVSISVNFSTNIAAGTLIKITDESGSTVMEFTNAKDCRNLIYSSDKLEMNKTYTVTAGEESVSITTSAVTTSNGGGFGGGRGGRW